MTRAEELLESGSRYEQAETVAAFLDLEGWPTYAKIVRNLALATEAGTAATVKQGAVHEGAGRRQRPDTVTPSSQDTDQ